MPRRTALKVLIDLDKPHKTLQEVLNEALTNSELKIRDKAFVTELIYNYLRREYTLHHILNSYLSEPKKIPRNLYLSMALSCAELLNLSKIPAYATIDFTVQHCKKKFSLGLASLVNAVLRQIDRDREKYIYPESFTDLSLKYSLNPELLQIFQNNFSKKDLDFVARNFLSTPSSVYRVNNSYLDAKALHIYYCQKLGLQAESELAFSLDQRLKVKEAKELEKNVKTGRISRQGLGSLKILERLPAHYLENEIIDACCGFGGKSLYLLEQGHNVALASDTSQKRLQAFQNNLKRLQLAEPEITRCPAQNLKFQDYPQTVILDVPCSGLGTLARRPDVKRNYSTEKFQELEALQYDILSSVWQKIASGSSIIYITCTIRKEENQEQIEKLLQAYPYPHTRLDLPIDLSFPADGRDLLFASIITRA